jgi:hypothetical protein
MSYFKSTSPFLYSFFHLYTITRHYIILFTLSQQALEYLQLSLKILNIVDVGFVGNAFIFSIHFLQIRHTKVMN